MSIFCFENESRGSVVWEVGSSTGLGFSKVGLTEAETADLQHKRILCRGKTTTGGLKTPEEDGVITIEAMVGIVVIFFIINENRTAPTIFETPEISSRETALMVSETTTIDERMILGVEEEEALVVAVKEWRSIWASTLRSRIYRNPTIFLIPAALRLLLPMILNARIEFWGMTH